MNTINVLGNNELQRIIALNNTVTDRHQFHAQARDLLLKMGRDKDFWYTVFRQNLTDKNFLQRKWTMYEIPFFYVFENTDFYIKAHLFVPLKNYLPNVAASAVHHHNNYLLTTFAAFGPGYETMLFEKEIRIDPDTKEAKLKLRKHFTQKDEPIHLVDSWEPHVVINPVSLSATLVLWSPDKKRATDSLRSNPLLKAIKTPLRKLLYFLKLDKQVGIAAKDTYQFYPGKNKFHAIPEDDFFAPTRAQAGTAVDDYSVQTLFAFMQRMDFDDVAFLEQLKKSPDVPSYYHKWIDMVIEKKPIPDTFAKETINIPSGKMTVADIYAAFEKPAKKPV